MKCYNCSKLAMYGVGEPGKEVPLCLDCYTQWSNVQQQNLDNLRHMMNFASAQMESSVGMPAGFLPRLEGAPKRINYERLHMTNINVSNAQIGVLNTGSVGTIDATITLLRNEGNTAWGDAIRQMTQALVDTKDLNESNKNEAMELLAALSKEGVTPKPERKGGVIRALMSRLGELFVASEALRSLWEHLSPIFLG